MNKDVHFVFFYIQRGRRAVERRCITVSVYAARSDQDISKARGTGRQAAAEQHGTQCSMPSWACKRTDKAAVTATARQVCSHGGGLQQLPAIVESNAAQKTLATLHCLPLFSGRRDATQLIMQQAVTTGGPLAAAAADAEAQSHPRMTEHKNDHGRTTTEGHVAPPPLHRYAAGGAQREGREWLTPPQPK